MLRFSFARQRTLCMARRWRPYVRRGVPELCAPPHLVACVCVLWESSSAFPVSGEHVLRCVRSDGSDLQIASQTQTRKHTRTRTHLIKSAWRSSWLHRCVMQRTYASDRRRRRRTTNSVYINEITCRRRSRSSADRRGRSSGFIIMWFSECSACGPNGEQCEQAARDTIPLTNAAPVVGCS